MTHNQVEILKLRELERANKAKEDLAKAELPAKYLSSVVKGIPKFTLGGIKR